MIFKLVDTYTWHPATLRQDFPGTSFPRDLSTAVLPDGYVYCHPTTPPDCGQFEAVTQADPSMVDGKLTQQWTVAPWPVPDIVAAKLAEIRAERKRIEAMPIEVDGTVYDMDSTARAKYVETMTTFAAFPGLEIPEWKASDDPGTGLGDYVTMTEPLLESVWVAGMYQTMSAFAWESARQAEVDAAVMAGDTAALVAVSAVYDEGGV